MATTVSVVTLAARGMQAVIFGTRKWRRERRNIRHGMVFDPALGTEFHRSIGTRIAAMIKTSLQEHVINGNSASSILVPHIDKQLNGSKIIIAGATMENNHRNPASDGRYLTFVLFSLS